VQQHVVGNVPAGDECRLRRVYDVLHGWPKPPHQRLSYNLQITVEQGDGPVAGRVGAQLTSPLVDQSDEAEALAL
jgi:hypothetical protein